MILWLITLRVVLNYYLYLITRSTNCILNKNETTDFQGTLKMDPEKGCGGIRPTHNLSHRVSYPLAQVFRPFLIAMVYNSHTSEISPYVH